MRDETQRIGDQPTKGSLNESREIRTSSQVSDSPKKGPEIKLDASLQTEKGFGCLKFYKQGPKVEIGSIKTRKFRLLEALFDPLGVAKTVDVVFESIKLPKDKSDSRLGNDYLSGERKRELIDYTMKELQKIAELTGKIRLEYVNNKRSVRLILDA